MDAMTANTVLSDINEIYTGYVLNGKKWFDKEAQKQYNQRVAEAQIDEVADAQGKAEVMAKEFIAWAKSNGYSGTVKQVWWTARPGSMGEAYGAPVDQKKNPTDILVKFTSGPKNSKGFLGLSAKATKGSGDIGFKNPGIGTIDKNLNMTLASDYKKILDLIVESLGLPKSAQDRKNAIRSNPGVKKHTEATGVKVLATLREELFAKLKTMKQDELLKYLLSDWMDAEILRPAYVKVTGQGNKLPYKAVVMDPTDNEKLKALSTYEIKLERVGNESIGVKAGDKKIMKIRFKFESEKMASSLKLSGEPW